jgi:hypothetical protein
MTKPVLVGHYDLGLVHCWMYGLPGVDGGKFWYSHPDTNQPTIHVGLNNKWQGVVATLLHEVAEAAAMQLEARYFHSQDYADDNGSQLFVMSHTQFSEIMGRVAWFLSPALPDLAKVYRRHGRKP